MKDTYSRLIVAKLKATPVLECGDTGDLVASRCDKVNTYSGWINTAVFFYVPATARSIEDAVILDISELTSGFFVNPVHPITGEKVKPVSKF